MWQVVSDISISQDVVAELRVVAVTVASAGRWPESRDEFGGAPSSI